MLATYWIIKDGVDFRFKGCKKYNYTKITLNGDDLYNLLIGRLVTRGAQMGNIEAYRNVPERIDAESLTKDCLPM